MVDSNRLPDDYDKMVSLDRLKHGEHNVRRVPPSPDLVKSIERHGIQQALIVRPDPEDNQFHVTDGWQRYQAAMQVGFNELPVNIYDDVIEALNQAELYSTVDEWNTYHHASHCQSLAEELEGAVDGNLVDEVTKRVNRSPRQVKRYLKALSLPEEIYPLLKESDNTKDAEWLPLKNYARNKESNIKQRNLQWDAAAKLGEFSDELGDEELIRLAAYASGLDDTETAIEFIEEAVENPDLTLSEVYHGLMHGGEHEDYLQVPTVAIKMEKENRRAIMDFCDKQRVSIADIAEHQMREFAEKVKEGRPELADKM